ncbi:LuxR C-terminal-related transcriptional regulator [Ammonicoccus fulvus]|uniref:LuxR C-terminal-related transcriptional regulator n=1 Tax=Ammonicoccus fulvus TaxID=3138240 RepID=A0ABZ3FLW1_9ACTN
MRQLDELPGGSVVSVVAPIGSDQDELVRLWDRYGSLRPRKILPAAPGESLFDGLIRALDTLKGVAFEKVDDFDGLLEVLAEHRFLLVLDSDTIAAYGAELADYLDRIPPLSIALLIDSRTPDLRVRPGEGGRAIRLTRHQLAVTAADFEQAPLSDWPTWARELVVDYAGGWPFALRTISDLLAQDVREIDAALVKDALVTACAPVVEAAFAPRDADVAATAQFLADCGPLGSSDFDDAGRGELLAALNEFIDAPLPMIAVSEGCWSVSPMLRDLLVAEPLAGKDARRDFALAIADRRVRAGEYVAATDLLSDLEDREALKQFTAQWAFRSSFKGHPEIGLKLLARLPREDVFGNPDLLLAYAVADLTSVNVPAVAHWSDLLKFHEDPAAPPWTSRDPRTGQCLRQLAELEPHGDALLQAMSGPTRWVGMAHVSTAGRLAARGDLVRVEGILDAVGHFNDRSLVVWGWRQALLMDLYSRTDREDRAIEIYRQVMPQLEESRFAEQRVTFFLDATLAKSALLADEPAEAQRLAARSLEKTSEIRLGLQTVRLHAYVFVAEVAVALGLTALARQALDCATEVQNDAPVDAARLLADLARCREVDDTADGAGLTAAQKRVLTHLGGPYPVPHIAHLMYVSPSTVRTHIRAIYKALDVNSRAEAVDRAREMGLID